MCVCIYLLYVYIHIYYTYVLYIYSGLLYPLGVPEFVSLKVPLLALHLGGKGNFPARYGSDRSLVGWRWTVLGSYRVLAIQPAAMDFLSARTGI